MQLNQKIRVLLIEDEAFDVERIRNTLKPFADRIQIVDVLANGVAAVERLEKDSRDVDVVIMDFQIAGGLMGEKLIRRLKAIDPTLQIIVVTKMTINITDFEFANRLLEAGATWYCTKYPGDIDQFIYQPTDFILSIFNAYEKKKLEEEKLRSNRKLQKTVEDILSRKKIVGTSPVIQQLKEQIAQLSQSDTNVLIRGPSGSGKELVAANIHYNSKRRFENFVAINCGSLPQNLIESELFGYERGAFTGATARKQGLFEIAHRGSIFLDEITELPLSAQSTLLRVIQEGEIDKIGRTRRVQVDVRIIAATNKNLEEEVRAGRFREDLYYRLNVVSIYVPPLSKRKEDIPVLLDYFLERFSQDMSRKIPEITPAAMKALVDFEWPGNVRQLQNVVQRLLLMGKDVLDERDIQLALGFQLQLAGQERARGNGVFWDEENLLPWREMERKIKKEYFRFVREHASSDAEAARILGLAPPNFHRACKELGLK